MWRLEGSELALEFDLVFKSDLGVISAEEANASLRHKDGTLHNLTTKDPENKEIELFINKDQMPKHKREAILTKRLLKSIERVHGDSKGIYFHRNSRTLRFKGKQVAKVECKNFVEFDVFWIYDLVQETGIDKAAVVKDFRSHSGVAANVPWAI